MIIKTLLQKQEFEILRKFGRSDLNYFQIGHVFLSVLSHGTVLKKCKELYLKTENVFMTYSEFSQVIKHDDKKCVLFTALLHPVFSNRMIFPLNAFI